MGKCKVCELIPNNVSLELDASNLELSSRAVAEKWGSIGKTTINKHRASCLSKPQEAATDHQEVIWNGDKGELRTGSLESDLSGMSHDEILRLFGHNPETVEISGVLRERHSQYWSRDLDKMLWKHSYSYALVRKRNAGLDSIDAVELMKSIDANSRPVIAQNGGEESTFVLDWADWQMAKLEGGGSDGLIERLQDAFNSAEERIWELRSIGRALNELVIFGGGDMVEGCVIYPNQSYEIDDHRRGQIKNTVAMIIKGIKQLAPHFDSVRVVVVPGNHGEHRIAGNRTTIGDNDDLLVFEMAQVGIESDPEYSHVSFEIAEKEISLATKVQGWTYGVTHGDIYGKGSGTGVRNKVFNWFKTMAANRHAVGSADVLVTHHFHHDALEDWGATLWVQNPTMDGGSHYFVEATGHKPKHGMNSWVVTQQERFQDKQVLR